MPALPATSSGPPALVDAARDIVLVLPHQLYDRHPLLERAADGRVVVFEEPLLLGDVDFDPGWHPITIAWRRAALEDWYAAHPRAQRIEWRGRRRASDQREELVRVLRGLANAAPGEEPAALHLLDPVDDWMTRRASDAAGAAGMRLDLHDGPGFLLGDADARATLGDRGRARMSTFYQRQRRRFDVLLAPDGSPLGGRWSFDEDNRKRLPRELRGQRAPWPWPQRDGELGWCHHIERLMVLGNYLFLTETSPNAVYEYFTAQFTDALDWVMVTNVHGMSQDAAGGLLTTKPYFSGSAYLRRMGWPAGAWCDTWDALYWRFIIRHADELRGNVRWAMAVRTADGFDAARRRELVARAEAHIEACR